MNTCVGKAAFEVLWNALMQGFPKARKYMEEQFGGENMKRWALPWQVLPNNPPTGLFSVKLCHQFGKRRAGELFYTNRSAQC